MNPPSTTRTSPTGAWPLPSATRSAGDRAKVLVDTGHHLPGCNIEHIVAFLIDERLLGGFHFNDRKYADDDLTVGSIDPYQLYLIYNELVLAERETGADLSVAYMIDQSHNIKPKTEAMIETVVTLCPRALHQGPPRRPRRRCRRPRAR